MITKRKIMVAGKNRTRFIALPKEIGKKYSKAEEVYFEIKHIHFKLICKCLKCKAKWEISLGDKIICPAHKNVSVKDYIVIDTIIHDVLNE